jgi:hypothetical protein
MSEDAFVVKLTAPIPAPDPVVLTYGDLEALEAAALLAVGEDLLAPPDPNADLYDEEADAAASRSLAVVWQKLNHARRDGRPVIVEPTMPPEWSRPGDPLDDLGDGQEGA